MKIVQVTIEDSCHAALTDAAKINRISMAEVIRQVLAAWAARRARKGGAS